jgi:hypothetical protein
MVGLDEAPADGLALEPALAAGTLLGKRYVDAGEFELLVTRAGIGSLSIGSLQLETKAVKALPASD